MTTLRNRRNRGGNDSSSIRTGSIPSDNMQTLHHNELKGSRRSIRNGIQVVIPMSDIKVFK
jgi:hypothetical protein